MSTAESRLLDELGLPLGPEAGLLDAIAIAIAVEDVCEVTIPETLIDVAHLGRRSAIEDLLRTLREPA